jgi:hypothetical protein
MMTYDFIQDGRCYLEKKPRNVHRFYCCYDGIFIRSRASEKGEQTIIVDPTVQVRSRANLLQLLETELKRRGLSHWTEAKDYQDEINKAFRSRAYSLRTTYMELRKGIPQHITYRFIGFDFNEGLNEDSDPRNPVNFHRAYGREFSMDQPVVYVRAKGGFMPKHIPELLEEQPTMKMLKRLGASAKIQSRALMDATDRYFTTIELLQPLIKEDMIHPEPIRVWTKEYKPVILEVEGDYIEIKSNFDFQEIFRKGKLLKKPEIRCIHIFSTIADAKSARRLLRVLRRVFEKFDLSFPKICEHLDCPDELEAFKEKLMKTATTEDFKQDELVLVVFRFSDEDIENEVYNSIKARSITKLFPVQFINTETIEASKTNKELRTDVVNLLFLQIVAKCRGKPYGLQPGFAPAGTIFIGLDRYRDPFKKEAPWITTVVLLDNRGSYVCSSADITHTIEESDISLLVRACLEKFMSLTGGEKIRLIIYILDGGVGTWREQLEIDANRCHSVASEFGASYVFLTANSGSHLRLYQGDPSHALGAKRPSSFTAAVKMQNPREILIVSTEPIIDKTTRRELGTPKPVLYQIFALSEGMDPEKIKETVAKCIIWLCKHSWIAPASTRLPMPLFFANKLSRMVSDTGIPLSPDATIAPLFL